MSSNAYTVITGGGSGIGQALAWKLAEGGRKVLIVGRREQALLETQSKFPQLIELVVADVSSAQGREAVLQHIDSSNIDLPHAVEALVHNAAVLDPVGRFESLDVARFEYHLQVNLLAPLFLTQALIPRLKGGRVLHISSGAAHNAYVGWSAYCISKAALHMGWKSLKLELVELGIRVGSLRPGVVDTSMQDRVRQSSIEDFPNLPRFIQLKQEGQLTPPDMAARFIDWVLFKTADDQFEAQEWDLRDESHHHCWNAAE